jgi:glutaconate CoA-transferase subunit B
MVSPVQLDRFGQANISTIGDRAAPKVAMLGARGFPGNSICHPNSFFIPNHTTRSFVTNEVDFVCMAGYNSERYMNGKPPKGLDLRIIVSDLCVMDFNGPEKSIRVVSLHPGVSFEQVQENTGFELKKASETLPLTPAPSDEHMALLETLDPNNVRASVLKDNPPAIRD